ncbi:MAG: hypothetical protein C0598_03930 [Marinilabiliales bacterium]|nr:MAG: hypothetical protein C0598_03930 [Marinilabiliales bacterium]
MVSKEKQSKTTIYSQLIQRGRIILVLIVLILVASQIVVSLLKKSSNEFLIEYNEVNAIQDFKLSLYQLLLQINIIEHTVNDNDEEFFKILIYNANDKLAECKKIITTSHDTEFLHNFDNKLSRIEHLSNNLFELESISETKKNEVISLLKNDITEGLNEIDAILIEIKEETIFYGEINDTVFRHSSITILILGIIIIIVIISGGLRFIKNFTQPIYELVETTELIAEGKRGLKVKSQYTQEFTLLSNSFNNMLESLERTTVSKGYLDSIINNMFDSLIVTDTSLKIQSINRSANKLLGKSLSDLLGKPIEEVVSKFKPIISSKLDEIENLYKQIELINKATGFINNGKEVVPALISCTPLIMEDGHIEGVIILGHDLRDKIKIEKKLDETRKKKQIYINEAQEKERLRIATDLHDGLGQMLTAIMYSSQEMQNLEIGQEEKRKALIQKIQNQTDAAIKESKNLAHDLIPILLKDFGLIPAINSLIEKANEMSKINFSFNSFDFNERIDSKLEKALYRICQESLNNIIKHSMAKNANYQIFKQDRLIVLVIDDDGCGFDINFENEINREGIGLIGMRERVLAFGGSFSLDSQLNSGTEIIIEIPC